MKSECQMRGLQPVRILRVAVNKAADQIVKAEEVLPPSGPARTVTADEEDERSPSGRSRERRPTIPRPRIRTALERLRQSERHLDQALEASDGRFQRGETTWQEMKDEQRRLVDAFNALVRAENIRYRGMLRPSS